MFAFQTHAFNSQKCLLIMDLCGYFSIHPTCSIHRHQHSVDLGLFSQRHWLPATLAAKPTAQLRESHPTGILRPTPTVSLRAMTITYRPDGQLNGKFSEIDESKGGTRWYETNVLHFSSDPNKKKRRLPVQHRLMHCFHHTCRLAECVAAVNRGKKLED